MAPSSLRERCLFKESCSQYVLAGAREHGTSEALKRLTKRMRQCRPGYARLGTAMSSGPDLVLVRLVDGTVIDESQMSDRVQREFRQA